MDKGSKRLKRPCEDCQEYYTPNTTSGKLCEDCLKKRRIKAVAKSNERFKDIKDGHKQEYFLNKSKLDELRSNVTLEKWKLLSINYKLGKKIWGASFTRERLAYDMDMPYTTVLRCLSLDKASEKSWEKVKSGKLSVFKLAMICSRNKLKYQDEIVDMVITSNLSTYKIKDLKVEQVSDISKEKHRLATEDGYSRKSSAYLHFSNWIERGDRFMKMKPTQLSEDKIDEIKNGLKILNKKINEYLKEIK